MVLCNKKLDYVVLIQIALFLFHHYNIVEFIKLWLIVVCEELCLCEI